MMKFFPCLMVIVSLVWLNGAAAEVPTAADLKAYQAFKTAPEYTGDDVLKKLEIEWAKKEDAQCFLEHVCAAEGRIGLSLKCEKDLSLCLYSLETKGVSSDPNSYYAQTCAPLFKAMTPIQNAMIASPKGCEVPPPPSAVQPTMTTREAQCLADKYCTEHPDLVGWEALCRKDYDACTRSLSEMDVPGRALCRGKRELGLIGQTPRLSPNGPCRPEMADPVLATVRGETNTLPSTPSKHRTLQEQVGGESQSKTDEFDLGDLDF